jgi:hypothetical protein
MYFVCHTTKEPFFTKGYAYVIVDEFENEYQIEDDEGTPHFLTKEPDYAGNSYATFMDKHGEDD